MTQQDLFQTATSSQQDTHASPLVLPGSKEAKKMTAISGLKYTKLFKQNDPIGLFARMFLDTSTWGSTKCYLTWKPKTTPANRLLFQLAPSTPRTDATDSGLLHTPTATANQMAPSMKSRDAGSWWATPDASARGSRAADLVKNGSTVERRGSGQLRGIDLQTQVKMWPTPLAANAKGAVKNRFMGSETYRSNLDEAVRTHIGDGQLNPQWVEWLMGYPEGWTDLEG